VPVEDVNLNEWKQDPWAGNIADGYIWGRGTLDDKSSAVAILTAAENLIKEGYQPEADLYFIFGHDEEIGGDEGAGAIANYFKQKGIKTKFHLDEGGMCATGMIPFVEKPVILLGTAEKGYMTVEVKVKMKGGHFSKPENETATSVLISALDKIERHEFPATMSPVLSDFIDYVGPEMKMPAKLLFTNKWLFKPYILYAYQQVGGEGNAVTRTTSTTTILNAGVKKNTVPSEASAKVNFRLLTGHKSSDVLQTLKNIVNDGRVVFTPTNNTAEASPITSTESFGFKTTQKVCADIFPDAAVSPFLMIGATDSKHFTDFSQSLIRCLPVRMNKEQLSSVHGVNKRIKIEDYMEMIAFYKKMMTTL
jgi:carboxypeptidase PM20D1